jgi:hypothetical protein
LNKDLEERKTELNEIKVPQSQTDANVLDGVFGNPGTTGTGIT